MKEIFTSFREPGQIVPNAINAKDPNIRADNPYDLDNRCSIEPRDESNTQTRFHSV